jgi:hypothetical protein
MAHSVLRAWYRLLGAGPLVLLLALAPSLLYLGHWSQLWNAALGHSAMDSEEAEEHVHHCHLAVASCGNQPIPATLRVDVATIVDEPKPSLSLTPVRVTVTTMTEFISTPPTEPPRL